MTQRFVQTPVTALYSGISTVATVAIITPYPKDLDGTKLTITDFGDTPTITIDPKVSGYEEICSFTGITDNGDGTATLTGLSRDLISKYPYTTAGTGKQHGASAIVVFSDNPQMYGRLASKENNETITGSWTFPAPVTGLNPATKTYVDNLYNGGSTTFDRLTTVGTAGETVAAGNIVYLKAADGRWWKASSAASATIDLLQLGIAQGAGTAGNLIAGGVLLKGLDTNQSGLTGGTIYYLSTGGAIASSAGTVERAIGQANTTTTLYFDPVYFYIPTAAQKAAMAGSVGIPSSINKFVTETSLFNNNFGDGSDGDVTIAAGTTTLTKNMFYNNLTLNGTLATGGYLVFVKGTISGAGKLQGVLGNNGSNAVNQTGGAGGTSSGGFLKTTAGGAGANGGSGSSQVGYSPSATSVNLYGIGVSSAASVGGTGGNAPSYAGAVGATGAIPTAPYVGLQKSPMSYFALDISATGSTIFYTAAGQAGGGGSAGTDTSGGNYGGGGGGAGASGGIVWLNAYAWTGTFTIESKGGVGGNGGNGLSGGGGGGGAGGSGGTSVVTYNKKTWAGSYTLTGGAGGTGNGGPGGSYTAGTNGATGVTGTSYEFQR